MTTELASSRVCQDIVLKAISKGPFNRNVTIKGGVVMRSLTNNNRRATEMIRILIFDDSGMYEKSMSDIIRRLRSTFRDEQYLKRASESRQRWLDNDIHEIADSILSYLEKF